MRKEIPENLFNYYIQCEAERICVRVRKVQEGSKDTVDKKYFVKREEVFLLVGKRSQS